MKSKQNGNEIIITTKKIIDNVKRYWWIVLVAFAFSIIFIGIEAKKGNSTTDKLYSCQTMMYMVPKQIDGVGQQDDSELLGGYTDAYRDGTLYANSENISGILEKLAATQSVQKKLEDQLKSQGYELQDSDITNIKKDSRSRLITYTSDGVDLERTTFLVNAYTEIIVNEMNTLLPEQSISIVQSADASNYVEQSLAASNKMLSVKNLFIVILFLVASFIVIFIFILFDKRIRTADEVANFYDGLCLGVIKNSKNWKENTYQISAAIIYQMRHLGYKRVMLIPCAGKKLQKSVIENVVTQCNQNEHALEVSNAREIEEVIERVRKIEQTDGIVVVISGNDDRTKEVIDTMNSLLVMGKKIVGYIVVERSGS